MRRAHAMPFGAAVLPGGGVRFALWAPSLEEVCLEYEFDDGTVSLPMVRDARGWHRLVVALAQADHRYHYRLPNGQCVPDPASRFNPADAQGASMVIDPSAYAWQDQAWRGRPWYEVVLYELHLGTFTPEGSFAAARQRLAQLVELGVTAVELMPLAAMAGRRNSGYDGVALFAPDAAYGTPHELKALVDTAHGLGLVVLMDVVYNPTHPTPWGAAIHFDGPQSRTVRDFFVHNALYWTQEFHFDGLRMDAVHAMRDDSPVHIVREICDTLRGGPGRERPVHVVLDNQARQASWLERDARGAQRIGTAQWNDDPHHVAQVPVAQLGCALAQGFICHAQPSRHDLGAARGEFGTLGDPVLLRAVFACVLLSPHTPMLVMGDEFAAPNHREWWAGIKHLLALRQRWLVPLLASPCGPGRFRCTGDTLWVEWTLGTPSAQALGPQWCLLAHFGAKTVGGVCKPAGSVVYALGTHADTASTLQLARGAVHVTLQKASHAKWRRRRKKGG